MFSLVISQHSFGLARVTAIEKQIRLYLLAHKGHLARVRLTVAPGPLQIAWAGDTEEIDTRSIRLSVRQIVKSAITAAQKKEDERLRRKRVASQFDEVAS